MLIFKLFFYGNSQKFGWPHPRGGGPGHAPWGTGALKALPNRANVKVWEFVIRDNLNKKYQCFPNLVIDWYNEWVQEILNLFFEDDLQDILIAWFFLFQVTKQCLKIQVLPSFFQLTFPVVFQLLCLLFIFQAFLDSTFWNNFNLN